MSYTLQRAVNDGQVTYNVAVDSTTEVKECKIPVPQNFPVDLLIHVRVFAIGEITEHSFTARFDLYVNWPEQIVGAVEFAQRVEDLSLAGGGASRALAWQPLIRFPNALNYTQDMQVIFADASRRRIGTRRTIQGSFKISSTRNSADFPFDVVPLELVMQLGFERNSKQQLYAEKYRFAMNPEQPNLMYAQHDLEYSFRPLRHHLATTTPLEAPQAISKFIAVVPATRKWHRHVHRLVPLLVILNAASIFVFFLPAKEMAARMATSLLILASILLVKIMRMGHWPTSQHITWLDKYFYGSTFVSFLAFALGTIASSAAATPSTNLVAVIVCLTTMAAFNIFMYNEACSILLRAPQKAGKMGKIDDVHVRLLEHQGLSLSEDTGTVQDIDRYEKVLANWV